MPEDDSKYLEWQLTARQGSGVSKGYQVDEGLDRRHVKIYAISGTGN